MKTINPFLTGTQNLSTTMSYHHDFKISKNKTPQTILEKLNQYGIVVIPNYLEPQETEQLKQEFHKLLDIKADFVEPLDYSVGEAVKVFRDKIDVNQFPHIAETFGSDFMTEITDNYLNTPNLLNHQIYVVKDVVGISHVAQDLHFDVIPTLKFFIYLTDTTAKNGAFHCVPGSHEYTRKIQQENRNQGIKPEREQTRQLPPEIAKNLIPIEGNAGTLIIFHTDVFHKAGIVEEGERLVMRGHSRKSEVFNTYISSPSYSRSSKPTWQELALKPIRKIKNLIIKSNK